MAFNILHLLSPQDLALLAGSFLTLKATYNLFFHPLRAFAGPWYCGFSRIWFVKANWQGVLHLRLNELHEAYGPIVRIAPDELSFVDVRAWQEIYGRNHRSESHSTTLFQKDPFFYSTFLSDTNTLIDAEGAEHKTQRQTIAFAFSHRGLAKSESMYEAQATVAINHLRCHIPISNEEGKPASIDINTWILNATLEQAGLTTIGESIGALESFPKVHPAIHSLEVAFTILKKYFLCRYIAFYLLDALASILGYLCLRVPGFWATVDGVTPYVNRRLSKLDKRDDLVSLMLSDDTTTEQDILSIKKMAYVMINAGTETTSRHLTITLYLLLSNPRALHRLTTELRSTHATAKSITVSSIAKLPYLTACIKESFRVFPPIFLAPPRKTPLEGAVICDTYIPGNATIGIHHWAINHSKTNFVRPGEYVPERWLDHRGKEFEADRREALHPFSYGPRSCIAKDMAQMVSRLYISRLLWEYDLVLDPKTKEFWPEGGKGFVTHESRPLYVHMRRRPDLSEKND